eukprot:1195005-Prorocentrum_minimum.AAC.1
MRKWCVEVKKVRKAQRTVSAPGMQLLKPSSVPENIAPLSIQTVGNYAVQISWPDGLNQVAHLHPDGVGNYAVQISWPDGLNQVAHLHTDGVDNYAVQISWPDGLNQVATYELLSELERVLPSSDWGKRDEALAKVRTRAPHAH